MYETVAPDSLYSILPSLPPWPGSRVSRLTISSVNITVCVLLSQYSHHSIMETFSILLFLPHIISHVWLVQQNTDMENYWTLPFADLLDFVFKSVNYDYYEGWLLHLSIFKDKDVWSVLTTQNSLHPVSFLVILTPWDINTS